MSERAPESEDELKTGELRGRLAGVLVAGVGVMLLAAGWAVPDWFLMVSLLLGPMIVLTGMGMVVVGPEVPMRRGHTLVETMSSIGAAVGVLAYILIRVAGFWATSGADA